MGTAVEVEVDLLKSTSRSAATLFESAVAGGLRVRFGVGVPVSVGHEPTVGSVVA